MSIIRPRTTCLQGEPGSGKSQMAILTAIHKPVYGMDIDNKMHSAEWAQGAIANGDIIVWEVAEPVDETNLISRLHALTGSLTKAGPTVRPKGCVAWAEQFYRLPDICKASPFGTVLVDSATLLNDHIRS